MEIISIIAILISPVIAVVIGQILQNKKEKNNRKWGIRSLPVIFTNNFYI